MSDCSNDSDEKSPTPIRIAILATASAVQQKVDLHIEMELKRSMVRNEPLTVACTSLRSSLSRMKYNTNLSLDRKSSSLIGLPLLQKTRSSKFVT